MKTPLPATTTLSPSLFSALEETVPKGFRLGTHRWVPPGETVARVRRLMPVMGITRIANVTGLDCIGIPVVMVTRPNSRSLSVSQGKGLDLAAAQASGLMESVESYHAEHITLPLKLASYEELRYTHNVVEVDPLPRTPDSRFHPYLPIHWIEGYDLLQEEPVWVPFDLVHTNYALSTHRGMSGFNPTSNGLASGNHLLEAISHGLCEVVERDATTMWRLLDEPARARTRVDLDTVADPGCRSLLEKYARAHVAVAAWEITSDVGIPAFLCRIFDEHDNLFRRLGHTECMGCHPAPEIALSRALTEAAQSRLTMIAGSRDDVFLSKFTQQFDPTLHARLRAELDRMPATRRFDSSAAWRADTFDEDVEWELDRVRRAGFKRAIVVDLTRPEFGLPVARVIVPGLEALMKEQGYAMGERAKARVSTDGQP